MEKARKLSKLSNYDTDDKNDVYNTRGSSPTPGNQQNGVSIKRSRIVTLVQIGEDWLYLALLGIIMALLSFSMDSIITLFLNARLWLFSDIDEENLVARYLSWCVPPIILVLFSSSFVNLCSPTAIGSGIPEMKTILRGVVLNEYLTFRTLIAKVVGLTFTLGSGLPLGKEGPFVHMASIVATLLSKLVASFQGIYENESRTSEMLSAACAVGVAATFYAPIGGVLFSIEVTTVYFAVRNYWRGFFAACCGATIWRLLGYWFKNDEAITALFKTNFRTDYPFDPVELIVFSFIGASCGLLGAAYIRFHREIVQFFRRHKRLSEFLQKNRYVYPILVTLTIASVTFPPFIGKYTASTLSTHTTIEHLFSNRTWSLGSQDMVSKRILDEWTTPDTSFYLHLILYIAMLFWTSALASTIPIPSGLFIPVLKMGAAYGRLFGELMHATFPDGIRYDTNLSASIVPGSYAVVGAAALSGAVTHTISTSVILFEMTGQIVHIIPVILGVLISNAVCQSLQPSIYDSIIEIKKLPYLPPIASSNSVSHKILVKDFMNRDLAYIWKKRCSYADVKALLIKHKKIISFPVVESPDTMKLLGSVSRPDLLKLLYVHLGRERRLQEVCRRNSETVGPALNQLRDPHKFIETSPDGQRDVSDLGLQFSTAHKQSTSSSAGSDQTVGSISLSEDGLVSKPVLSNAVLAIPEQDHRLHVPDINSPRQRRLSKQLTPIVDVETITLGQKLNKRKESVAKLVNRYDLGSPMDEEHVDRSRKEIQNQITSSCESPGIVITLPNLTLPETAPGSDKDNNNKSDNTLEVNQLPATIPPSPSLRPKSILKTSSSNNLISNMTRRNFSPKNFANLPTSLDNYESESRPSSDVLAAADSGGKITFVASSSPPRQRRKVRLPQLRVVDMTPEEQEKWEVEQLSAYININKCQLDEAPFQLVEQTSLYRVHTLFSMLGLNHAYVTSFGRLVGIVALKDIRDALEKVVQEK